MKPFEMIKNLVATANNETLKEMLEELRNGKYSTEEILVMTAIELEFEKRGIMKFNEETFEYEYVK